MSNYTPRLTAPSNSDLRWIQVNSGGYNRCIYGSNGAPSVLPDCTGYVHGRIMELLGVNTDYNGLSFGNGSDYWAGSDLTIWTQTQTPRLGAVVCYRQKDDYSGTSYGAAGHVAVVEQIIDSDTIVISESNWGGSYFQTLTCYRQYGWRPNSGYYTTAQGFLYRDDIDPGTAETTTGGLILALLQRRRKKRGVKVI